ncbi:DNA polymerase III subunit beta [Planctomycetota bacterium]|nr:DNA polymerase III subunit beta [Planctomycetota bacterium]
MDHPAVSPAPTLLIECQRDVLLAAIQAADAVVPTSSTRPILTNLLLEATDDRLEIIATDLQVGLRCVVRQVDIRGRGQAVVPARKLAELLKESSSPTVLLRHEVRGEASQLAIQLADGDYAVQAVIGEPFPAVAGFPTDHQVFSLPGRRFAGMLSRTAFAMDKDRTSAVLSGMMVAVGHGELVLAATDGKVLAEAVDKSEGFTPADGECLVIVLPATTVAHVQRIMAGNEPERVDLAVAGKVACLRLNLAQGLQVDLTSRLVDGTFPSYRNALVAKPVTEAGAVQFRTADLAAAVRRAALMTSSNSRGIVINLDSDRAVLNNLNHTTGTARIPVACVYRGNPQRFAIDHKYLQDVLRVYEAETFGIELGRGLVMREPEATYLIMPISLPS